MKGEVEGKRVCVTGASGYIASWLIKLLLHRGYTVNATVRDLDDPEKTDHLMAMEGAKERLHLYKADLLEEGSFDSAIDDCDGVFHTASPVIFGAKDSQTELLEPALKGTLNVLSSCAKFASVKRVVLTSSIVAVMFTDKLGTPGVVIDETFFTNPDSCKEAMMHGYVTSKAMAEQAAWKFAKAKGIDMVAINPAMVLGPLLQPKLNVGVSTILQLINGAKTYQNFAMCWVHIKDVTDAHILAYETPSANGRYILTESVVHHADTVKLLHEMYPTLQLPDKCEDDGPLMPTYEVTKEKTRSLGIKDFVPFDVSLKETVETLKENGFISF